MLTNLSGLVDVSGLDAHLTPEGVDDSWAIGANETRFGLALERVDDLCESNTKQALLRSAHSRHEEMYNATYPDFIFLGNAFGDANNEAYLVFYGLNDSVRGAWRWHI